MLTSKQRSYLRGLASNIEPIFQVGKNGVTPELIESVNDALEAREIVKGTVLNNCMDDIHNVASVISERTQSETVQVIGKKIIFYKQSKKKPIIELPK